MSPKKKPIADGVIDEPASTALARVPTSGGLAMQMTTSEAVKRLRELQKFIKKVMVEGEDYGKIPGIAKPTLLQPGAQKLQEVYGLYPEWEWVEVVKDWDRPFFYFESKCTLRRRDDDRKAGEGLGSCNSKETKYAGRWVPESDVPSHLKKDELEKREGFAWVFQKDIPKDVDPSSVERRDLVSKKPPHRPYSQWRVALPTYLIPNADLASQVNTMQKIAAKRAHTMAVIGATRSSGIFTQDVEDMPHGAIKVDEEERVEAPPKPPETGPKRPRKPPPVALSTAAQQDLFLKLLDMIRAAADVENLRAVHAQINGHRLDLMKELFEQLGEKLRVRKSELEPKQPSEPNDANDAWGIKSAPTETAPEGDSRS